MIDTGDTAWVLISAALVMLMTPGLALFYGGLVRRKNVLSTIMHSFFMLALISVQWVLWGYTLAFGPDGWPGIIGGLEWVGPRRRPGRRSDVYAHDRPAPRLHGLPDDVRRHHAGAHHRRVRRAQALQGLRPVQPRSGRRSSTTRSRTGCGSPDGWLYALGVLDFAGGTVVHISSGVAALVAALMLGRRMGLGRARHRAARPAR